MRLLLHIFFLILFAFSLHGQINRALIVAISDYPIESGWDETHAVNDCELIIPMLKANGYKSSNIHSLLDRQAAKQNIVNALKRLAVQSNAQDHIYIHFSGHGQQMADDNGDEPDGLDEAFIPYDAFYRYVPGKYEGENHLRDDELEQLIDQIRYKVGKGGNVTIVLDACYSGTGTRIVDEDDYIRGTSYLFAPAGFEPKQDKQNGNHSDFRTGDTLSPVTVFSACQPDELNYEYKMGTPPVYYGSLSWFFCETIRERKGSETHQSFYLRLKEKMSNYFTKRNKSQTPYFESTDKGSIFDISK